VGKGSVLVSSIGDALALFLCYRWSSYADALIGAIVTLGSAKRGRCLGQAAERLRSLVTRSLPPYHSYNISQHQGIRASWFISHNKRIY